VAEDLDMSTERHQTTSEGDWRVRQAGYDQTGVSYSRGNYGSRLGRAYLRARTDHLVRAADAHFGEAAELDVLEIGCGTGLTLEALQQRPRWRLHGIDFSRTMLGEAARRVRAAGATTALALGNALELPFGDACFDVVYATRFIHQFPHRDKLRIAAEIARVLRPGGLVALEFYARALNRLRFHTTQRDKYATRALYFSHYPSRSEVREIAGGEPRYQALRYPGDRLINRLFGYRAFSFGEALVTRTPGLHWLASERWGFYTPLSRRTPRDLTRQPSTAPSWRCPTCHGELAQEAQDAARLICAPCARAYATDGGLPNLLSHEASALGA
jgi:ubiquinone/menaquinone biosynthesis C-methylase UbiE/uncharacterized protein YbaR (Trm112 family)